MIRNYLHVLVCFFCSLTVSAQTVVQRNGEVFQLVRNGQPYYVKGVGGEVNFDRMVEVGANSLRTWGVDHAQEVLDEAQKRGLSVMLGFWLQQERNGYDYNDTLKVRQQFEYFKTVVEKFKNHPALLLWGIGNELDLDYSNPTVWYAVQDLAKYIHQSDPNHPTSTVIAGLDSMDVVYIAARCPDIDILGINTYGDIGHVPTDIHRFGWKGPYMITEWGPNGHWESPQTNWNVSIEQSSTEKKMCYLQRYRDYIEPYKGQCLGSYAFLWGAKQEYTETWYGLFSKENLPTEPVDGLEELFTGKKVTHPAPSIVRFTIDGREANQNVELKSGVVYTAQLQTGIQEADSVERMMPYTWRIMEESTDKKSGGDVEREAREIRRYLRRAHTTSSLAFRAPAQAGMYRLFVSLTRNGKVAYANIPFKVIGRAPGEKQTRFAQFKYVDMKSFKQQ